MDQNEFEQRLGNAREHLAAVTHEANDLIRDALEAVGARKPVEVRTPHGRRLVMDRLNVDYARLAEQAEKKAAAPRSAPSTTQSKPASSRWRMRPRKPKGRISKEVYPQFAAIPSYGEITDVIMALPTGPLRAYLYMAIKANTDGETNPSWDQTAAEALQGKSRSAARRAIEVLLGAGLIEKLRPGAQGRPTLYRLMPRKGFSRARALEFLTKVRQARQAGVEGARRRRRMAA